MSLRDHCDSHLRPQAAQQDDSPRHRDIARIRTAAETIFSGGPHATLPQVKHTILRAASKALLTERVALFTIDPCLGGVECEGTPDAADELNAVAWEMFGNLVTDRESKCAWSKPDVERDEACSSRAREVFAAYDVRAVIASPIRSNFGASGALVAYYETPIDSPEAAACLIDSVVAQASAAISYALTLEQNRFLMDDLAGANQELSVQASLDGLTGLANHRSLQTRLSELCHRGRETRERPVFSLVMIDVDHFKQYNDLHGHQEGDTALCDVARIISSGLRQRDYAARYGGEEFSLVLAGIGKDDALAVADRLRRAVAEHSFTKGRLTISLGVAEFPSDGRTPDEVIERSDRAMYHAKHTGRNRVVVWGSASSGLTDQDEPSQKTDSASRCVLVVQDPGKAPSAVSLAGMLSAPGHDMKNVQSCEDAIETLKTRCFDIALVAASAVRGEYRALTLLSAIHPDMPLLLVADSTLSTEQSREAWRVGVSDVIPKPHTPSDLANAIERSVERTRVERQRLAQKSNSVMMQAIDALTAAIDAKDPYTAAHSQRVTALALALSDQLSIPNEERSALELAAQLHDVGKIGLPDTALNKKSPLTDDEWQAMREHPVVGSKIVGSIDDLAYVSTIIRHHHERLDGTGYPDGLQGNAVPLLAQVIAVADTYETMTSERAHCTPLTPAEAIEELHLHADAYYASTIVQALERHLVETGVIAVRDAA